MAQEPPKRQPVPNAADAFRAVAEPVRDSMLATLPKDLKPKVKALMALELRKGGVKYDVIATTLGFRTPNAAAKAVAACIRLAQRESASEFIEMELQNLELLKSKLWNEVLGATKVPPSVVNSYLNIQRRACQLQGIALKDAGEDSEPLEQVVERGAGTKPGQTYNDWEQTDEFDVLEQVIEAEFTDIEPHTNGVAPETNGTVHGEEH